MDTAAGQAAGGRQWVGSTTMWTNEKQGGNVGLCPAADKVAPCEVARPAAAGGSWDDYKAAEAEEEEEDDEQDDADMMFS